MSKVEMKLQGRETIEVFISDDGFICLKQESSISEVPSIVKVHPSDVPRIVEWLQKLAVELPLTDRP